MRQGRESGIPILFSVLFLVALVLTITLVFVSWTAAVWEELRVYVKNRSGYGR